MAESKTIRLATRASQLALWQANHVAGLLRHLAPELNVEIVELATIGDRDRATQLAAMGGQGVFTKEIQSAVLDGRADIAVHSLKDLPTDPTDGLLLAGVPQREIRFDALVLPDGQALSSLDELPPGSRVGSGSLRRQAQLLHARPDLELDDIRGNVETRLRKVDKGEYDAVLLAEAGLIRLGLADRISLRLEPPLMYPAIGQAALGLECREDDAETQELLKSISDLVAFEEVRAERACLAALRAGCHAPVGALSHVSIEDTTVTLEGVVLSPDGKQRLCKSVTGKSGEPEQVGSQVARILLDGGADELINP